MKLPGRLYHETQIKLAYNSNRRVGRLLMFRECLRNNIISFIIEDSRKRSYYNGLREFATVRDYLMDTCLSAQDTYTAWVKHFYPDNL